MKSNITVVAIAASMLTMVACGHKMESRRAGAGTPAVKPGPDKVNTDKTPDGKTVAGTVTIDPQCPQGVEGIWEVRKSVESKGFWDLAGYIKVKSEFFDIGRNDKGVLQLTKADLIDTIVFDGQPHAIGFKDKRGSPTKENAVYTAKCVAGVVFVSEKKGKVEQTFEYRLNGDDATGLLMTTTDGKTSGEIVNKSLATPDAGV